MNKYLSIVLLIFLSEVALSEEVTDEYKHHHHPIWPTLIGAGLITWGVYDLGGNTEESQRNVKLLWGSTLALTTGIILYQASTEKGTQIAISPSANAPANLVLSYRY